ncbi:sugar efflux transporter [Vibrio sp.]|uniref:MFS transporter n=1 Tax=Vibrio viridaestus TaxID=2487322 RepID=A0A3N9U8S3_9VIBR|nr:sugar efflux transporter [Vibrio viridaestus]MDC0609746.1 sugar efflux transporter [Vibrio sp.]RQW64616.1 MFS transporter [Vibrio viridaestus]
MNTTLKPSRFAFFKGESGLYFGINGLTALAFSFIIPVMSLFLIEELHIEPGYIGFYTVGTALSTMLISQVMGALSDKGVSGKYLYLVTSAALVFGALSFALLQEFWQAMLVGIVFMSFGASSIPVLLAMIRHYAERSGKNSTKINSQMRSSVSLLWIVGPALAFASVDQFGARTNFIMAAFIAFCVFMLAYIKLPVMKREPAIETDNNVGHKKKAPLPGKVWFLGVAIFFASVSNSTYINAMPLYLTKELGFDLSLPGVLLGLTAALEIPVMLIAASWSQKFGKVQLMIMSFISAMIFYAGIQFAHTVTTFLALQLFNGLFFGIFVGLGVTVMQDFAPKTIGKVSAFYTNTMSIGTMCGTSMMGVIAQYYNYKAALFSSLITVFISFVLFCAFYFYSKHHNPIDLAKEASL